MATLLLASITPCLAPAQSIITTVAGSRYSFTDGLTALNTPVGAVNAVVTDRAGLVYFADLTSDRVYRIDSRGIASVFAGNGVSGYAGDDGLATSASLSNPRSLALDGAGNLYIADSGNSRIRKVTAAGVISTVAGNGVQGFSGDGGTATKASLGGQVRIALDARGDLYISDPDNNRVRRVSGDGIIRTVVGTGGGFHRGWRPRHLSHAAATCRPRLRCDR